MSSIVPTYGRPVTFCASGVFYRKTETNMSTIPKDPYMLLSFINMHLRDDGEPLPELCKSLGIDQKELVDKLNKAGFEYIPSVNQFR